MAYYSYQTVLTGANKSLQTFSITLLTSGNIRNEISDEIFQLCISNNTPELFDKLMF